MSIPAEFRGLGARIEDILVTAQGPVKLITALPHDADEVEQRVAAVAINALNKEFRHDSQAGPRP